MKVLITGGTGTVGKSLIKLNDNEYIKTNANFYQNFTKLKFVHSSNSRSFAQLKKESSSKI